MNQRQIEYVSIATLKPHPKNVRTHPNKQIGQIERSIASIGFTSPIIVDENYIILAGHARFEAAKRAKLHIVPVIVITGLSDAKKRAYLLADNKLADKAGYDRPALAIELYELTPLLAEAGLDIALTGFEPAEIDALMGDLVDPEQDPADELPEIAQKPVSLKGDLWLLGQHRLLCGDAKEDADLRKLIGRELAAMVFTDPPYNVRISSIQG
jgi:ParB-like chromosome segregation protein Spo0J